VCRLCGDVLSLQASGTTTHLKNHLNEYHKIKLEWFEGDLAEHTTLENSFQKWKVLPKSLWIQLVAADCLPFTVVEGQGFRMLLQAAKVKVPSRKAVARYLLPVVDGFKTFVRPVLPCSSLQIRSILFSDDV
jgi:hypothetical protein